MTQLHSLSLALSLFRLQLLLRNNKSFIIIVIIVVVFDAKTPAAVLYACRWHDA